MNRGTIIIIIIALLVLAGGGMMYSKNKTSVSVPVDTQQTSDTEQSLVTPTAAVTSQDTSDKALDQDFVDIDTKLKASDEDAANIDTGLNDKQDDLGGI